LPHLPALAPEPPPFSGEHRKKLLDSSSMLVILHLPPGRKLKPSTTIGFQTEERGNEMKVRVLLTSLALAVGFMVASSASAQDNHYACYQAKDLKTPKLASKQTGSFADSVAAGTFEKCKLKYVCVPTDKNGSGIPDPSLNYCCHQCKGFKGAVNVGVSDQFINGNVQLKKLKFICNPCSIL
jgi:hypothetical protein